MFNEDFVKIITRTRPRAIKIITKSIEKLKALKAFFPSINQYPSLIH